MKKNVFIIGLGRYGQSLAVNLHNNGQNVTIADINEDKVKEVSTSFNFMGALILNSTNYDALESTSITSADYVVVALSNIEDSIMTCVNLKDLGIKNITAKVRNKTHKRVLKSLGIRDLIFPEDHAAEQTANQIMNDDVVIITKGRENTILKLTVTSDKLINKTVKSVQSEFFKIFALIHNASTSETKYLIDDEIIKKLDRLFIICPNDKLKVIKKLFIEE
ncbi:MAG: potassium channel family protein [Mycoplasma sp.]